MSALAAPIPWRAIAQAIQAVDTEAARRGEMFPQSADEQREDRAAVRRVVEMLEWYATCGGAVAERLPSWPQLPSLTPGELTTLAERRRQIETERWSEAHDDEHDDGSMAVAAAAYALVDHPAVGIVSAEQLWMAAGWDTSWFKPKDTLSNLVRATALLQAEIDRRTRAAQGATHA